MYADVKYWMGSEYVTCEVSESAVDEDPPCSMNTMLFVFSVMQYLICCLCLSIGKPFRRPFYTNPFFLVSVTVMVVYQMYIIAYQDSWTMSTFAILELPLNYRIWIIAMVLGNSICSYVFEKIIVVRFTRYWNNKYKKLS